MKKEYEVDMEAAVKRYADMVYRLASVHTQTIQDAEDVFQDVFLKLLRYKKRIVSEEHLKAWLIRVTVNQCITKATQAAKHNVVPLDTALVEGVKEEKEEFSELYEAVKQLPLKYRQVIYLYYYDEYKISEIATILKKNESTIKTWLSRGRQMLNHMLKGGFDNVE